MSMNAARLGYETSATRSQASAVGVTDQHVLGPAVQMTLPAAGLDHLDDLVAVVPVGGGARRLGLVGVLLGVVVGRAKCNRLIITTSPSRVRGRTR